MPANPPASLPPKDALRLIAIAALVEVAGDVQAPAAARAGAGRTLLEYNGDIGRLQEMAHQADKPLTELSDGELNSEIARLQRRR